MKIARDMSASVVISATLFTLAVLIVSYVLLGLLPMFLFTFGFLGALFFGLLFQPMPHSVQ